MDAQHADDHRLQRLARASSLALDPRGYADVPTDIAGALRSVCLRLPEVTENQAWAGTQWRVRRRTFAHVLTIDFADGPVTVLTFRSSGPELDALRRSRLPFFQPAWGTDAVGLVLDGSVAGDEVAELVTESYCLVAPRKLADRVERPTA